MSLRKNYKLSQERLNNGAPIRLAPNDDGSVPTIFVRRIGPGDTEYNKAVERIFAPHRRAQETGVMSETLRQQLLLQVFAEGGIASWENVKLSDVTGDLKDEGFAEATAAHKIALLQALPELDAELRTIAAQRELFLESNVEAEAKN